MPGEKIICIFLMGGLMFLHTSFGNFGSDRFMANCIERSRREDDK